MIHKAQRNERGSIFQISPYQTKAVCILHFANGRTPGLFRGGYLYVFITAKLAINYEFNTMCRYFLRHIRAIFSPDYTGADFPKHKFNNEVVSILGDMIIETERLYNWGNMPNR